MISRPWLFHLCCFNEDNKDNKDNKDKRNYKNQNDYNIDENVYYDTEDLSNSFLTYTTSDSNLTNLSSSGSECPRILSVDDLNNLIVINNKKTDN